MIDLPVPIEHYFLIHIINSCVYCLRHNRSTFYQPSFHIRDFVCSAPEDHGTSICSDITPYYLDGMQCHGSFENNTAVNNSDCVNWNQYYNNCTPNGPNPFYNTTSFDNIGMAWIAIFQVRKISKTFKKLKVHLFHGKLFTLGMTISVSTGYYPGRVVRYHVFCPGCA